MLTDEQKKEFILYKRYFIIGLLLGGLSVLVFLTGLSVDSHWIVWLSSLIFIASQVVMFISIYQILPSIFRSI